MKKVFSFLAFLLVGLFGYGQVKFYASLSTKSVPVNQNFQLSYTIENGEGKTLKLPSLNDFNVLSGPNTSQSVQWINGSVSQTSTYSYILQPKKEGTFKIGKAIVNVGGANLESNELSITVTGPAQQKAQQRQNNSPFGFDPFEDPFGDPFEAMAQQQEEDVQPSKQALSDIDKQIRENVFVRMVTNKNSVYEGEP
ncbi:MAG: BatD family protein, partial [Chitinophagales bacterium]